MGVCPGASSEFSNITNTGDRFREETFEQVKIHM